ncbi:hypothetical protein NtRootA4_34410 [Arthrobacter sp. NtRootA4]|nr:hypothetical protein NtRootA2_36610 [Arthrobacter sp. NtRootA2]BCW16462.1 hypothetical protein NtRootA4_34410 [Arthrobacter sp. NtRootA4]BCW24795.1 hypothetical protein NtRootC7_36620 [Arthrobacter sp. NtRootC7]BCW29064.1 hypothetical protein NtRootC45_36640 [Arthrobacter sp. NtRootC45]BCW33334.1 hypothetical protein NtRootD5_36650 [Arthrobacter sp. NtRootD5]
MLRLEGGKEALADAHGVEASEAFQVRPHHHGAKLGNPGGIGGNGGAEDKVRHGSSLCGTAEP